MKHLVLLALFLFTTTSNAIAQDNDLRDIWDAIAKGKVNRVKELLNRGTFVDVRNEEAGGATPLMGAAFGGKYQIAKLLIEKGADVNARCDNGATPLHFAATKGNYNLTKLLIEKGADINARCDNGATPLFLAVEQNQTKVSKLLIEKGADESSRKNDLRESNSYDYKIYDDAIACKIEYRMVKNSDVYWLYLAVTNNGAFPVIITLKVFLNDAYDPTQVISTKYLSLEGYQRKTEIGPFSIPKGGNWGVNWDRQN